MSEWRSEFFLDSSGSLVPGPGSPVRRGGVWKTVTGTNYDSEIGRSRRVLVEFSIAKVNSADRTQHNPGVHTTHHIHIAKLRTSFGVTSFRPFRAPDHTAHCPHMIASAG